MVLGSLLTQQTEIVLWTAIKVDFARTNVNAVLAICLFKCP
jgi:hypothetical protein